MKYLICYFVCYIYSSIFMQRSCSVLLSTEVAPSLLYFNVKFLHNYTRLHKIIIRLINLTVTIE